MKKNQKSITLKRMGEFYVKPFNSLPICELERMHLEDGRRFTVEDGKITSIEIMIPIQTI